MKEKVLYVKLSERAKYTKTVVTENGVIAIIFSEEGEELIEPEKEKNQEVIIPKPKMLVGGTEVYQKCGSPYWYCKLKNGRDEFCYLYMKDLKEQDLLYDCKTGELRKFKTRRQKQFKVNVLEALANIPEEGFRWVPVFEPSSDGNGGIQFTEGKMPLVGLDCFEWERLSKSYSPQNESRRCSIHTYFLQALRWLKDRKATLEELADDSENIGFYSSSKHIKQDFELTGEREFGGLYGFVGNTCKIVEDLSSESGSSLVGGSFDEESDECPMADVFDVDDPDYQDYYSVGLIELKK